MRLEAGRLGGTRRLTRAGASDSRSRCQWRPTAQPARGCRGGHRRASACARGMRRERDTIARRPLPPASSGYHSVIIGTCVCTHNSSTLSSSPGSMPISWSLRHNSTSWFSEAEAGEGPPNWRPFLVCWGDISMSDIGSPRRVSGVLRRRVVL
eukprot:COSAG02_NODE_4282_length_5550_cov_40.147814_5_plen_153_part_00